MAQWVKVPAAKCIDMSSVPGTHVVEDEEELPVLLSMYVSAYVCTYVCAVTFACMLAWIPMLWEEEWGDDDGSGQEKTFSKCSRNLVHVLEISTNEKALLPRSRCSRGEAAAQEEEVFPRHSAGSYLGEVRGCGGGTEEQPWSKRLRRNVPLEILRNRGRVGYYSWISNKLTSLGDFSPLVFSQLAAIFLVLVKFNRAEHFD